MRGKIVDAGIDSHTLFEIGDRNDSQRHKLPDDRGARRPGNTHGGAAQKPVDHNRVKDDIGKRPGKLANHGDGGFAGCHHDFFKAHIAQRTERENRDDAQVGGAHIGNDGVRRLRGNKRAGKGKPKHKNQHKVAQRHKDGIARRAVCLLFVPAAQTFGNQRVDADAGADAQRDDQHLHGKSQCQRVDGLVAHSCDLCSVGNVGYKKGVHHIVKRLPQHGDHHRRAHIEQQFVYRHFCHFISALRVHRNSLLFLLFGVTPYDPDILPR